MALVVTRTPGEELVLTTSAGERIVIEAEPAPAPGRPDDVRIAVSAPRSVVVVRGELEYRTRAVPLRPGRR